jgi:hypothetical protein
LPNLTVGGTPVYTSIPFLKTNTGATKSAFSSPGRLTGQGEWISPLQGCSCFSWVSFIKRLGAETFGVIFDISDGTNTLVSPFLNTSGFLTNYGTLNGDIAGFISTPTAIPLSASQDHDWVAIYGHFDFANDEIGVGFCRMDLYSDIAVTNSRRGEITCDYITASAGWTAPRANMNIPSGTDCFSIFGSVGGFNTPNISMAYFGMFLDKKMDKGELTQCFSAFMRGNFL